MKHPPSETEAMLDTIAQIKTVLGANARTLESLGYPRDEAIEILANALAYYLDERFHIRTRALLGVGEQVDQVDP